MKIERISENQIRCTLTREDLSSRQIRLSELTYGSDKARQLFHDMMREAEYAVGFSPENSPLMIEAIPTSVDSIVLVITKVEDPEELDTRFSRFTKSDEEASASQPASSFGADDVLDLFHKIYEARKSENSPAAKIQAAQERPRPQPAREQQSPAVNLVQAFRFSSLDDLVMAAHSLDDLYEGRNTVYVSGKAERTYLLVLHQSDYTPEEFYKICNMLSEYGKNEAVSPAREASLAEHGEVLIKNRALQDLALLPV